MDTRPRPVLALSVVTAMVCGALGGALYVTFSLSGDPSPAQVNIHQVAATSQPTVTVTAKPVVVQAKPVKKAVTKVTKKTSTTTTRSFVSTQPQDPTPDPTTTSEPPPLNGGGTEITPQPIHNPHTSPPAPSPSPTN